MISKIPIRCHFSAGFKLDAFENRLTDPNTEVVHQQGIGQALSSSGNRKRGPVELVFFGASKKA